MADATLDDLLKSLKKQNEALSTLSDAATGESKTKVTDIENQREQEKKDAEVVNTLQKIADTLGKGIQVDLRDKKKKSILGIFKEGLLGGLGIPKDMTIGKLLFGKIGKKIAALALTFGTSLGSAFASVGKIFVTTIGPQLLKFAGPLALIAGLALAIKDGIAGYFMADEWGVSKTSAVMGSVLGGTGSGFKNAFKNAGKWALIGVGIGMIGGPPGMIIGGLIGAAIGGILGYIGGAKLAKGFDAIGVWFVGLWDTVVDAISAVWHAVMPKWFTDIDFEWTDIFPTGLVKLFTGKYFTVDVPSFHWYSLMPNFLVEWFKGTAKKVMDKPWSWTDIFPKFLVDFFTGAVAKDTYEFKWTDLFPQWLVKIIESATSAFTETPFTWKSLLPDFIVGIIEGTKIKAGSWEWTDLFPGWLTKIITAGKKQGTTETGEFEWTRLLPGWMTSAWDSTKVIAESAFNWVSLLPGWLAGAWGDAKATGKSMLEGTFDWKALLPTWLHGAFDSSVAIKERAKEKLNAFNWTMLLPDFIADLIRGKEKQLIETASLAMDWWKSLLPNWIVNILEGKSPFAEREKVDEKLIADKKEKLKESVADLGMPDFEGMFDMNTMMFQPIRDKIAAAQADAGWIMAKVYPQLLKLFPEAGEDVPVKKSAKGGIVGMSPFATGSMGKAIGLESGGLFTLSQGEFILDNQAAKVFLQAAQLLTNSQALEQSRNGGPPVIINNVDNSQKTVANSNRATSFAVPTSPHNSQSTKQMLDEAYAFG